MNENPQVCGELFRPIKKISKPKIMTFSTSNWKIRTQLKIMRVIIYFFQKALRLNWQLKQAINRKKKIKLLSQNLKKKSDFQ